MQKINQFEIELKKKASKDEILYINNEFYYPDLFHLLKDQMYQLPIWSGIMLDEKYIPYDVKTRLSNNYVESWFSIFKNNILNKASEVNKVAE